MDLVYRAAVDAVLPRSLVERACHRVDHSTAVFGLTGQSPVTVPLSHNVHVVAFGKAVVGMIRATQDMLGEHIISVTASIPAGSSVDSVLPGPGVRIFEGARNNLPDDEAMHAAAEIHKVAASVTSVCIFYLCRAPRHF